MFWDIAILYLKKKKKSKISDPSSTKYINTYPLESEETLTVKVIYFAPFLDTHLKMQILGYACKVIGPMCTEQAKNLIG